jgi:hypothetical protein
MDNQHIDDAPRRDLSRQDATATDTDFTLSLEEVAEHYARAGHFRTPRSLQRYCVSGHLVAQKIATTTGDKYMVTPQSVARHIAQIKEFAALETVAPFRDVSRPVATAIAPEIPPAPQTVYSQQEPTVAPDRSRHVATESVSPVMETSVPPSTQRQEAATAPDMSRQGATEPAATGETSRYVEQLERQVEIAQEERDFLREQINRKDRTIEALIERDRETNFLVRGLQEMLTPLLGGRRHDPPAGHQSQ